MAGILFTRADSGKSIDVHVGDTILVRLDENATTGFLWQIDAGDHRVVTYVGSNYDGQSGDAIGAGDVRCMSFNAMSPGSARIRLRQCQEWAPDQAIDEFELAVQVRT